MKGEVSIPAQGRGAHSFVWSEVGMQPDRLVTRCIVRKGVRVLGPNQTEAPAAKPFPVLVCSTSSDMGAQQWSVPGE